MTFRRHGVQAGTRGEQFLEVAVDGQVEMRDGLLGQRHPLGDEAAHGVVGHQVVGARVVKGEHVGVGQAFVLRGLCRGDDLAAMGAVLRGFLLGERGRRFGRLGRGFRVFHIRFDDAAMGA